MEGLKARILNYNKQLEKLGRDYTKKLDRAPTGYSHLHEPDMKVGGLPTDVFRYGNSRNNSIIGGQATRIAKEILNMS